MDEDIKRWERKDGSEFIRRIGIEKGDVVLDFGAGYGHYTIPAADVVGNDGIVFAVDKREDPLSAIAEKASDYCFTDIIRTIKNTGDVTLKFKQNTLDHVLLFDILHTFRRDKRKILYRQIYNILKPGKTLSVYVKHALDGHHTGELKEDGKQNLIDEIEEEDLIFDREICETLPHDVELVQGCVLNFRKSVP